jgi:hypothetical protein
MRTDHCTKARRNVLDGTPPCKRLITLKCEAGDDPENPLDYDPYYAEKERHVHEAMCRCRIVRRLIPVMERLMWHVSDDTSPPKFEALRYQKCPHNTDNSFKTGE